MADLFPVAGCRLFIGGVISIGIADLVDADFAAQSWTEIDGWSTMGPLGDNTALITTALINRSRDVKQKGTANAGQMANVFAAIDDDAGQIALIAAAQPSNRSNYAYRMMLNDFPAERSAAATVTIAAPGVFTWVAHGLVIGRRIKFSTTGALPTGLVAGTEYFVKTTPLADTFSVSATAAGAAITTTGAQSGVHTAISLGEPSERLFAALAMSAQEQGGDANTIRNLNATLEVNSNVVKVAALGA